MPLELSLIEIDDLLESLQYSIQRVRDAESTTYAPR
jgi:hypothetical protein